MAKITTDIDIDFADRDSALVGMLHVPASKVANGKRSRHPTGVYFQDVPIDPITGQCALDFNDAGDKGYFKIDFLNNTIYSGVRDENHLIELMKDPNWDLFLDINYVSRLAHIHGEFELVSKFMPISVEDLATIIALIRPAKRHLINKPRHEIMSEIWAQSSDGYQYKRSHAIAYAMSIVVQLNLLCENSSLCR
jgi:hypothetical protein